MLAVATLCVSAPSLYGQVQGRGPDTLTSQERRVATELAEQAVTERGLRTTERIYLVDFELVRDKQDQSRRRAVVTHYRYDGDLAILTTVDLGRREVANQDTVPHLPVRLSAQEVDAARDLAYADSVVQEALEPYGDRVVVEPLLTRTTSPDDPLFGHRVVRLLFRVGRDYLEEPVVTVDLTTRRVIIEQAQRER